MLLLCACRLIIVQFVSLINTHYTMLDPATPPDSPVTNRRSMDNSMEQYLHHLDIETTDKNTTATSAAAGITGKGKANGKTTQRKRLVGAKRESLVSVLHSPPTRRKKMKEDEEAATTTPTVTPTPTAGVTPVPRGKRMLSKETEFEKLPETPKSVPNNTPDSTVKRKISAPAIKNKCTAQGSRKITQQKLVDRQIKPQAGGLSRSKSQAVDPFNFNDHHISEEEDAETTKKSKSKNSLSGHTSALQEDMEMLLILVSLMMFLILLLLFPLNLIKVIQINQ